MAALNLAGKTSGYVKLKSPDVALNATVELPNKDGVLATLDDVGSGSGGEGTVADGCIYLNNQTITSDYTFPAGKNGMSAGPIDVQGTVEVGDGTWTIVGEGGGETATLESLGIPNHDKVTVDANGAVGIGTDAPSEGFYGTIPNVKLALKGSDGTGNNGISTFLLGADNSHYASISAQHVGGGATNLMLGTASAGSNPTERMRIDANGMASFNDGVKIKTSTGADTLKLEQSNTTHGWLFKANESNGYLEFVRYGSGDGLKYSWGHDRCDIMVPLYVEGNPKSIDVQLSDMETRLADRDKIIDKLLAKVEALEAKLKKVK